MNKKIISIFMALIFVVGVFPMAYASASDGFNDYQQGILGYCNKYHYGTNLVLDARLCAMAAMLAVEQDGRSKMTAYRPNGQKWDTIFTDYGYSAMQASSGCNWMRSKSKPAARQIVEYWMKTPGFEENVRSSMYSHTGVYMHYSTKAKCYYIVQLFTKPSANQATDFPSIMEAVVTENVNVRSGPGTDYKRIGKLEKAQVVSILSESGEWAEIVMSQNRRGYVHKGYISFVCSSMAISQIDVPSTDPGSVGAAIATGNVNIRSGPGTNYKKLGKLRRGQTAAVWSITGKWAEITWTGSKKGYVHTDYLKFETASNEPKIAVPIVVPSTDPGSVGAAIATGNVNVRSGPGTNYKKLGKLHRGQTAAVWSITGKWAEITWTGNQKGYVHTDYLRMDAE